MATGPIDVRTAVMADYDFVAQDGCISSEALRHKIARGEVVVATAEGLNLGYARFDFLWTTIPYLSMLWVLERHRRQGVGKAMLAHLESRFRQDGHQALYSSSDANEPEPQAWHRHMGFEECGFIAGINAGGVGEIIFRKMLSTERTA